jgi:hypothetical protein
LRNSYNLKIILHNTMSSDDEDNRGTEEDYEYEYSDEDNHGGDDDEDVSMAGSSDAVDTDVGSRKSSDASSTKKRPFGSMDRRKNSFGGDNPNAPPGGKFGLLSGTPPTVISLSNDLFAHPFHLVVLMRRRWIWNTHAPRR